MSTRPSKASPGAGGPSPVRQPTTRTASENKERAYIAASRRNDRSLEARVESARQASRIHKERTGKSLKITEEIVRKEEMYEEEDDLPHSIMTSLQALHPDVRRNPRFVSWAATQFGLHGALSQHQQQVHHDFEQAFGPRTTFSSQAATYGPAAVRSPGVVASPPVPASHNFSDALSSPVMNQPHSYDSPDVSRVGTPASTCSTFSNNAFFPTHAAMPQQAVHQRSVSMSQLDQTNMSALQRAAVSPSSLFAKQRVVAGQRRSFNEIAASPHRMSPISHDSGPASGIPSPVPRDVSYDDHRNKRRRSAEATTLISDGVASYPRPTAAFTPALPQTLQDMMAHGGVFNNQSGQMDQNEQASYSPMQSLPVILPGGSTWVNSDSSFILQRPPRGRMSPQDEVKLEKKFKENPRMEATRELGQEPQHEVNDAADGLEIKDEPWAEDTNDMQQTPLAPGCPPTYSMNQRPQNAQLCQGSVGTFETYLDPDLFAGNDDFAYAFSDANENLNFDDFLVSSQNDTGNSS